MTGLERAGRDETPRSGLLNARPSPDESTVPVGLRVAVAFALSGDDLARLQARAGAGVEIRTIHQGGPPPDLVLCPPSSPQLIGRLRQQFPKAEIVVVELEDWLRSVHVEGPITRTLNAGASTYYVAPTTEALGEFLTELASGRLERHVDPGRSATGKLPADTRQVDKLALLGAPSRTRVSPGRRRRLTPHSSSVDVAFAGCPVRVRTSACRRRDCGRSVPAVSCRTSRFRPRG